MDSLASESKPLIMGILNVTPDSFSDGGKYGSTRDAVARGIEMVEEGADIIDIGGESTRPGSQRISAIEQKRRILDVIATLSREISDRAVISVDTTLAEVAQAAVDAGARMVNDVSGGVEDDAMFACISRNQVPYCLMHMQGTPETMQDNPQYTDVVTEVIGFLSGQANRLEQAGVLPENIILDPGIGFGKTLQHNLSLLHSLDRLVACGYPVLLGTSRKRFIDEINRSSDPTERMPATCATSALGVIAGVKVFRVHDVWQNRQAVDVAWAIHHAE